MRWRLKIRRLLQEVEGENWPGRVAVESGEEPLPFLNAPSWRHGLVFPENREQIFEEGRIGRQETIMSVPGEREARMKSHEISNLAGIGIQPGFSLYQNLPLQSSGFSLLPSRLTTIELESEVRPKPFTCWLTFAASMTTPLGGWQWVKRKGCAGNYYRFFSKIISVGSLSFRYEGVNMSIIRAGDNQCCHLPKGYDYRN